MSYSLAGYIKFLKNKTPRERNSVLTNSWLKSNLEPNEISYIYKYLSVLNKNKRNTNKVSENIMNKLISLKNKNNRTRLLNNYYKSHVINIRDKRGIEIELQKHDRAMKGRFVPRLTKKEKLYKKLKNLSPTEKRNKVEELKNWGFLTNVEAQNILSNKYFSNSNSKNKTVKPKLFSNSNSKNKINQNLFINRNKKIPNSL